MTSEKQAGFSLLEVIVSTAILFSVAGAFLSMTAANGVLLTREHSLMQNVYELMLSRLVDTFFSRTSWTMLLYAENHSISVA